MAKRRNHFLIDPNDVTGSVMRSIANPDLVYTEKRVYTAEGYKRLLETGGEALRRAAERKRIPGGQSAKARAKAKALAHRWRKERIARWREENGHEMWRSSEFGEIKPITQELRLLARLEAGRWYSARQIAELCHDIGPDVSIHGCIHHMANKGWLEKAAIEGAFNKNGSPKYGFRVSDLEQHWFAQALA